MPRPNLVLVGAQKAASTLLQRGLAEHPQVWMPASEDPTFRDPVFTPESLAALDRTCRDAAAPVVGMKCADYLGRPEVPGRLARHLDDPRIIVVLRDPIKRALSAYYWQVRWGFLPLEPVDLGLTRLLVTPEREWRRVHEEVLGWGLYGRLLIRYSEHFDESHLHVVLDDELSASPAAALAQVYRYLKIDDTGIPPSMKRRQNAGVYNHRRLRVLRLRNRAVVDWSHGEQYPTIPRPNRLIPRVFSDGIAAIDRYLLAPRVDNRPPALSAALMERLIDFYRSDVELTEAILDRDLVAWRRPVAGRGGPSIA